MKKAINLGQFKSETHVFVFSCKRCDVSVKIPKGLLPRFMGTTLLCIECGDAIWIEKKEINHERIENDKKTK